MTYTEEDEQRVYEEINRAVAKEMRSPSRLPQDEFMRHIARVALEAMKQEPLEDVLGGDLAVSHVSKDSGYLGWFAKVEDAIGVRYHGHGTTIDEAIRNAVSAAKGDE